jgi:hypothetical protein
LYESADRFENPVGLFRFRGVFSIWRTFF